MQKNQRNQAVTAQSHLKQFNYYLSGFDSKKKTTVVILIDTRTGRYARGVAICNKKDNFCKKTGREIALGRAIKALATKRSCAKNEIRDWSGLFALPDYFITKSAYMPALTSHEERILRTALNLDTDFSKEACREVA